MARALQLVGFRNNGEFFGIPISKVREILRVPEITAVPESPSFFRGIINLRGRIIPVIDMSRRLGREGAGAHRSNRILILDINGKAAGLLVDSVSEIVKIEEEAIDAPPEAVSSSGEGYITGIGRLRDRIIVLLGVEMLMSKSIANRVRPAPAPANAGDGAGAACAAQ